MFLSMFLSFKVRKALLMVCFLLASALSVNSCKSGSENSDDEGGINLQIDGVNGPTLSYSAEYLTITAVFEYVELIGGLRYSIPKYPNSYIEISPDLQTSGTLMSIHVSIEDLGGIDATSLPPQTLPGGRNLPGVVSGRLPAVAFTVESFRGMSFYLGNDFFGVFIPLELDLDNAIVTARFFSHGKRVGNLSLVGRDTNGENSGFLIMLDLNSVDQETQSVQVNDLGSNS